MSSGRNFCASGTVPQSSGPHEKLIPALAPPAFKKLLTAVGVLAPKSAEHFEASAKPDEPEFRQIRNEHIWEGFSSRPPHEREGDRLEITAGATERRHHRLAVLLNRRECNAVFCIELRRTGHALQNDGSCVAAHSQIDSGIVEAHLNLPRLARSRTS